MYDIIYLYISQHKYINICNIYNFRTNYDTTVKPTVFIPLSSRFELRLLVSCIRHIPKVPVYVCNQRITKTLFNGV